MTTEEQGQYFSHEYSYSASACHGLDVTSPVDCFPWFARFCSGYQRSLPTRSPLIKVHLRARPYNQLTRMSSANIVRASCIAALPQVAGVDLMVYSVKP